MIRVSIPETPEDLKPKIIVIGVGGAGGNAVNNMIRSKLEGVDFFIANTDAQAIANSLCDSRIQLGMGLTRGLGAGSRPDVGRAAAEEQIDEINQFLDGVNMVFVTAGMGGGTGTGAAPIIAQAAKEKGILTVGVVTKPFHFEGAHRMRTAESGIIELQQYVDTLIVIPNQNLFRIADEKTTFADAFKMADDVLYSGIRGVTDLMVMPGLINLDFADICSIMSEAGKAMMGTGESSIEKTGNNKRAIEAAEKAIANPLLDDVSLKGAKGVLVNITGGEDTTLFEVDEAATLIKEQADPNANIIVGSTIDPNLKGIIRVSLVATGIEQPANAVQKNRFDLFNNHAKVQTFNTQRPAQMSDSTANQAVQSSQAAKPAQQPQQNQAAPAQQSKPSSIGNMGQQPGLGFDQDAQSKIKINFPQGQGAQAEYGQAQNPYPSSSAQQVNPPYMKNMNVSQDYGVDYELEAETSSSSWLSKIPFLGRKFRNNSASADQHEYYASPRPSVHQTEEQMSENVTQMKSASRVSIKQERDQVNPSQLHSQNSPEQQTLNITTKPPTSDVQDLNEEDLSIPAFLRRQVN